MADKKKLLIVNDDMVADKSGTAHLIESLARRGIDVVVVANVDDALIQTKKTEFDLIITDISLKGDKTGLDLIKEIRKTDKQTKIFVATGFGDFYKQQAIEAGANLYFEKPMDLREHILAPLGLAEKPSIEKKEPAMAKSKVSLRRTVHDIGNKNNCTVMVSSILKNDVSEHLKKQKLSAETKELLDRVIEDLGDIYQAGKEADDLLKKVRETVYKQVDPDKLMVE